MSLFILSCTSSLVNYSTFNLSESEYESRIENFSDHTQKYDGPYNLFEVSATLLNSTVIEAQSLRQATVFDWNQSKYQTELQSRLENNKNKTQVFVSFYSPDKKSGDLLRADTLWKITLKFDGKEFQGKPKKLNLLPIEIKSLYPSFTRWSTGFMVTFDLPVVTFEKHPSELFITGPAGTAELKFKALN